jgi:hypothetical protein
VATAQPTLILPFISMAKTPNLWLRAFYVQ